MVYDLDLVQGAASSSPPVKWVTGSEEQEGIPTCHKIHGLQALVDIAEIGSNRVSKGCADNSLACPVATACTIAASPEGGVLRSGSRSGQISPLLRKFQLCVIKKTKTSQQNSL